MTDSEIIDAHGGTVAVSRKCEVAPQAVSQWRKNGIPKAQKKFLAAAYPKVLKDTLHLKARNSKETTRNS